jgi:hypothetical protein
LGSPQKIKEGVDLLLALASGRSTLASPSKWDKINTGLRLVSKRGDDFKKHPQTRLRVSFSKQIQHSRSESMPCFALPIRVYLRNLSRSFPLISPFGPTFGCSTAHLPRCLVVVKKWSICYANTLMAWASLVFFFEEELR